MLIDRYRAIGGGSPLCGIVERQRAAVTAELRLRGREVRVYHRVEAAFSAMVAA